MIIVPHLPQCHATGGLLRQLKTEILSPPENAWKKRCGIAEPANMNPQNVWDKLRAPGSMEVSHIGQVFFMGELMSRRRTQSMRIVFQSVTSRVPNPLSRMT